MLSPEQEEEYYQWELKEKELDFQNLQITYRHELMQVPEAEGLKEFLKDSEELYYSKVISK